MNWSKSKWIRRRSDGLNDYDIGRDSITRSRVLHIEHQISIDHRLDPQQDAVE